MKKKSWLWIGAAMLTGGCLTGNPASDGFIGGVVHLADGTYRQRQFELEEQAAATRVQYHTLSEEQRVLLREQETLQETAARLKGEMSVIDQEVKQLQRLLDGHMAATTESQARKQVLLAQLQRQSEELAQMQSGGEEFIVAREAEIARLEAELVKLREQTLLLMGL